MSEKNTAYMKYRELMYRFLASVFIEEVDQESLAAMLDMEFPEIDEPEANWEQDLKAGYEMLADVLDQYRGKSEEETKDMLEDLAADYAKTFLAAGDAAGKAAFPYESVYTGTDSQFGGSVQMNLNAEYAAKGYSMKEDMFKIMEDHIGLELNYMAELLKEQSEETDEKKADKLSKDMKKFFRRHISNWVMLFANDIYKYTDRDFYKAIARITIGFMELEQKTILG